MKHVLVIGLGVSGTSAAYFLYEQGVSVTATDRNLHTLDQHPFSCILEGSVLDVSKFDCVVVSPGVSPQHPYYQQALTAKIEVIGEVELALRYTNAPLLAVTGTNGKTTVTMLIAHVLNTSGIPARAVGNIGEPLTRCVDTEGKEVLVVELSSFQLETLGSQKFDAGVILNITPDHLDRYTTLEDYARAKIRLENCIKPGGTLIVHEKVLKDYRPLFAKKEITVFEGASSHDEENERAAFALCKTMGVSEEQFRAGAKTFTKPPHRMEFVSAYGGVRYINDSKGTNIDAVCRAMESLEGNVILIAGGVDKGASYDPWVEVFTGKLKTAILIGEAAEKIDRALSKNFPTQHASCLKEALQMANAIATKGDTVLLSPGCSSFDMFKNYEDRGDTFKSLVKAMEKGKL